MTHADDLALIEELTKRIAHRRKAPIITVGMNSTLAEWIEVNAGRLLAIARAGVEAREDTARLDWLEGMANQPGGLLLHDGSERGRLGLGLRPCFVSRTLREAIDDSARNAKGESDE